MAVFNQDVPFTPPPPNAQPPTLSSRHSHKYSEEERGAPRSTGSSKSSWSEGTTGELSPMPTRRLFDSGEKTPSRWRQYLVLAALSIIAALCWWPVIRLWIGRAAPVGPPRASVLEGEPSGAHVHVFHEPHCSGESVTIGLGAADLCGLKFPSGVAVSDNVASVLIASGGAAGRVALDVYGTCRLAEQPANPMLLESVAAEGCSELRYPLTGHLELRAKGGGDDDLEVEL